MTCKGRRGGQTDSLFTNLMSRSGPYRCSGSDETRGGDVGICCRSLVFILASVAALTTLIPRCIDVAW